MLKVRIHREKRGLAQDITTSPRSLLEESCAGALCETYTTTTVQLRFVAPMRCAYLRWHINSLSVLDRNESHR